MNRTDARSTVLALIGEIAPELDLDSVPDDEDLREAVDLDSLDFLNLVEMVHERTGVDVPEIDYDQVRTLDGWASYLSSRSG